MRFAALAVALHIAVSVSSLYPAASAQIPQAPTDSVPRDSARKDAAASDSIPADSVYRPVHPWWAALVLPGAVVVGAVAMVAPAPLAKLIDMGPEDMVFKKNHVAFRVSVGGRFSEGETWANAVSVEVVRKRVHGELQAEDFWRPRHVRYFTARGGYLWHAKGRAAGGLTVGYVHAEGATSQTGPELGLPLFIGSDKGTMGFEPTYVMSSGGPLWSYRLRMEGYAAGGRYVIGANVVQKSVRIGSQEPDALAPQAVTAVLGVRF
jgi:hypothetical protein